MDPYAYIHIQYIYFAILKLSEKYIYKGKIGTSIDVFKEDNSMWSDDKVVSSTIIYIKITIIETTF